MRATWSFVVAPVLCVKYELIICVAQFTKLFIVSSPLLRVES